MSCIKFDLTSKNTKIVRNKREYSNRERFPTTTKQLILIDLTITELDPKIICNLHNLSVLNLSHNRISFLPKQLGTLPHLEQLWLSHNCLGNTCLEIAKWEWMEQTAISQSLKELDISNNKLTELPVQIGKLQKLRCLSVSRNLLIKVPQIIGTLQRLVWLDVSTNLLSYLPGSMRGMELIYLHVANNPFKKDCLGVDDYTTPTPTPTPKVRKLSSLAAKAVKKYRIPYNNLPSILATYLDKFHTKGKVCCICREFCFYSNIKQFVILNGVFWYLGLKLLLSDLCMNDIIPDRRIPFKCYFCSSKCYATYCKRYQRDNILIQ